MYSIFLDNFRGFSRTCVDLRDVNFFVGENSTGKTSILWVIRLLSEGNFWFNLAFEVDGESFGQFADLASAGNPSRKSFSIGLSSAPPDKPAIDFAILLTFTEFEGMPRVERCYYHRRGLTLSCERSGHRLKWSVIDYSPSSNSCRPFEAWLDRPPQQKTPIKMGRLRGLAPFGVELITAQSIARRVTGNGAVPAAVQRKQKEDFDIPQLFESRSVAWIAPIRTKPKRTYDEYRLDFSAEGSHTPYLVKRMLATKKQAERFKGFLMRFGEESGLFRSVEIKRFGRGASAPFELRVVLDRASLGLHNVGYGVSQSLPIAVEAFARTRGSVLIVQQPEVHVHPRGQAALGGLILNTAVEDQKKFLVETHSDYLIDRFRGELRSSKAKSKPTAQILFFERSGGNNVPHAMEISDDGSIEGAMPDSYRRFFINESLRVIEIG